MQDPNKILIISGNLLKHKYVGIKLLKKYKNSNIIFEKYPKIISNNYSKTKSILITNHFKKVKFYEKKHFSKFCKKNSNFFNKKTLFSVSKGNINNSKILKKINKIKPKIIILNATSIIKKNFIEMYKNKIINIHAGIMPYYRGTGCNVWTFYNQELEYTGVTIHFINKDIDGGNIILQAQSDFKSHDNTHTIGCKNAKLSAKLSSRAIDYIINNPKYKGKKIKSKKNKVYFKKEFNENIVRKVEKLIKDGIVKKYLNNKKKIKLVKLN